MKKLVLSLMLVLSISMLVVSCAKKEEAAAPASDTTKVDTTKVDTVKADTTKKM